MVVVAVTGVALNHDEDLALSHRSVGIGWLLEWYGMSAPDRIVAYELNGRWLSAVGGRLYLDDRALETSVSGLLGAMDADGAILVAEADGLWLFDDEGVLIEKMPVPGGAREIVAVGHGAGHAVVDTDRGLFAGDADLLSWSSSEAAIEIVRPSPVPEMLRERLVVAHRGEGLPLDRVVLDLHSGRIFGAAGPYVFDAAGVALLFLAISGAVNWLGLRSARRLSERRRSAKLRRP